MLKTLIFFLFIILINIVYASEYDGYLSSNQDVNFTINSIFNDSSTSYDKVFSAEGDDTKIGIKLPKNATIISAYMNVSGNDSEYAADGSITLSKSIQVILGMDNNGTHFFMYSRTYNVGEGINFYNISVYDYNGDYDVSEEVQLSISGGFTTYGGLDENGTHYFVNNNTEIVVYKKDGTYVTTIDETGGGGCQSFQGDEGTGLDYNGSHFFLGTEEDYICVFDSNGNYHKNISLSDRASSLDPEGIYLTDNQQNFYLSTNSVNEIEKFPIAGVTETSNFARPTGGERITGDDNYIYVGVENNKIYKYHLGGVPTNVTVDVNGTAFFNNTDNHTTDNRTSDFKDYLQAALDDCSDTNGWCNVAINITSDTAGKVTVKDLDINYTYNLSESFQISEWWNLTSNFIAGTIQGVAKFYNYITVSTTIINITGYQVDSTSVCFIDGTSKTVGDDLWFSYCNLTTTEKTSSTKWNHTIYDATLGTGSPTNQTNSSQSSNTTHQIKYFNVTAYYPNGTLADLKIYNITAEIHLTESDLFLNNSPDNGVKWHDGSNWVSLNTTNRCTEAITGSETNYSNVTYSGNLWQACYNDTNENGEIDYYKIKIPELSIQQFYAYAEEDNINPNVTFTTPTGTYTSASNIPFNVTVTDNMAPDSCKYNITNDAGAVETATTSISCSEFNGTFSISGGNDDYIFYAWANDTAGNTNMSSQTFTVSIASVVAGGGGGGRDEELTCNESGNIWTVRTLFGRSGYTFGIPFENAKPVKKEIILTNYGEKNLTVELLCEKTDEMNISICDFVSFSSDSITLPPNPKEPKQVDMLVQYPNSTKIGEEFSFNVIANDKQYCQFKLNNKVYISRFSFSKWKTIEFSRFNEDWDDWDYPVLLPAILSWLIVLGIGYYVNKKIKSPFWGIFTIGILGGLAVFILVIFI